MKKKISAKRPVQKPQPGGLVYGAINAPIKAHVPLPAPTEEQAAIAYKIICSTPTYGDLRKEAEALLRRYLAADLNPKPEAHRSGYSYIPQGGSISTTAGAVTWSGT